MKKALAMTVILTGLTAGLILLGHRAGAEDQAKGDPCEMKIVEKAPYCELCQIILKGYSCSECKSRKCPKCAPAKDAPPEDTPPEGESAFQKPTYLFLEKEVLGGKKCPCCGKEKLAAADLVDKKDGHKCLRCGAKGAREVEVCVRPTYHCPEHQDAIALKIQPCKTEVEGSNGKPTTCKKSFVLRNTDRVLVKNIYVCFKCNIEVNVEGSVKILDDILAKKCMLCKGPIQQKKKCSRSGEFPHVKGTLAVKEAN